MAKLKKESKASWAIDQEYEIVPIDKLQLHPDNPNRGDVGVIAESIDINGWYGVVTAQRSTGYILAGNHRYLAAISRGADRVPVVWRDVDEVEALRILLVDNESARAGGYDQDALESVLDKLGTLTDGDLTGTGFGLKNLESVEKEREEREDVEDDLFEPEDDSDMETTWGVIVMCDGEQEQQEIFEEMKSRGYTVRCVAV